jgi:hypothetical protein
VIIQPTAAFRTVPALRAAPTAGATDRRRPQAGRRRAVGRLPGLPIRIRHTGRLPDLLHRAQTAADNLDGDDQDQARRLLRLTYQLAATQLTKLGETDLAWIAADRGLAAVRPTGARLSPAPCSDRQPRPALHWRV